MKDLDKSYQLNAEDTISLAEMYLDEVRIVGEDAMDEHFRKMDKTESDKKLRICWEHERYGAYFELVFHRLWDISKLLKDWREQYAKAH
ncbi:MAG: hypothetical protein LBK04_05035 [Clostridiales Family XIII bacterium]|jgi:hypothetical protein|nr:hypothetical protein [Clostridiales Family XIII bacterium]